MPNNVQCKKCGGSGKTGAWGLNCPNCKGRARVTSCPACKGSGEEGTWPTKRKCGRCRGSGAA